MWKSLQKPGVQHRCSAERAGTSVFSTKSIKVLCGRQKQQLPPASQKPLTRGKVSRPLIGCVTLAAARPGCRAKTLQGGRRAKGLGYQESGHYVSDYTNSSPIKGKFVQCESALPLGRLRARRGGDAAGRAPRPAAATRHLRQAAARRNPRQAAASPRHGRLGPLNASWSRRPGVAHFFVACVYNPMPVDCAHQASQARANGSVAAAVIGKIKVFAPHEFRASSARHAATGASRAAVSRMASGGSACAGAGASQPRAGGQPICSLPPQRRLLPPPPLSPRLLPPPLLPLGPRPLLQCRGDVHNPVLF